MYAQILLKKKSILYSRIFHLWNMSQCYAGKQLSSAQRKPTTDLYTFILATVSEIWYFSLQAFVALSFAKVHADISST